MYAEERQQAMAHLISRRGRLSVVELAEQFEVTTETVRRDLSALERMGLVRRVHGGAVPAGVAHRDRDRARRARPVPTPRPEGPDRRRRRSTCCPPAGRARCCIDAGSTTARLRRRSPPRPPADRRHPRGAGRRPAGRPSPSIELHLLPGRVRPTTQAAVGAETVAALADLRADVAFLGTNGITVGHGLSTPDRDEAATKRAIDRLRAPASSCSPTPPRSASRRAVRFADARRGRRAGHRRRHRRRRPRARSSAPASRWWSHDPHPHPQPEHRPHRRRSPAPLARGAVHRVASVTSQAGGKGVNISRAAVAAGIPSIAVLPAAQDDPFVHELLARRHRLPAGADPPATSGSTSRSPSPTAPPPSSTAPAPTVTADHLEALAQAAAAPRAAGADWVVLAGSLPAGRARRLLRRAGAPRCAEPGARVAVDTSEAPLQALVDALPDVRARPDEAQRRGARLLHRRATPTRLESDPPRRPRRPPHRSSTAASAPCWPPSAATAPCSSPPTAPGTPLRPPPPSSAPSVPATPACSATCSATSGAARRRSASRWPWPTAAPPPVSPAPPSPNPSQVRPELVAVDRPQPLHGRQ